MGRVLAAGLPTVSIAVIRYVIVIPVLFLILRFREGKIHIRREWIPTLVLLGIFSTTLYQIFFLYGVKYAAASDDSIVIGAGPRNDRCPRQCLYTGTFDKMEDSRSVSRIVRRRLDRFSES